MPNRNDGYAAGPLRYVYVDNVGSGPPLFSLKKLTGILLQHVRYRQDIVLHDPGPRKIIIWHCQSYLMHAGYGILFALCVAALVSTGCLSALFPYPSVPGQNQTPVSLPSPVPTTASPVSTVPVSQMALQPSDLPSDYILRDRSDITYLEMDQIARNLGWRAGYQVTYYHLNQEQYDMTTINQVIGIYTPTTMNTVFNIRVDALNGQGTGTSQIFELPCPSMGDHTFAYRTNDAQNPLSFSTYSIIFTKKDVYEELNMSGTTTDFELLKSLAQTASARIQ